MISDYVRLKKDEKKLINELSIDLNKIRLELNMGVLKESEVLHEVLKVALQRIEIDNGNLKIR